MSAGPPWATRFAYAPNTLTEINPMTEDEANADCLAKRRDGEPMFILLGRDPDAHNIVQMWAERRLAAGGDPNHCQLAYDVAERMRTYAADPDNAPVSAPKAEEYPHLSGFKKAIASSDVTDEDINWLQVEILHGRIMKSETRLEASRTLGVLREILADARNP